MMDEMFDRTYQAGRSELNDLLHQGVTRAGHSIYSGFKVLNRIEYTAPWAPRKKIGRA
jgi:hypothetical protein